ncbi:MAG: transcriptional regulator, partial [Gammaproteobacteria bacterium]|nr:transcriptional regulator [Gammaproteobacteria bacterium]
VGRLQQRLGIPGSTLSHHIGHLVSCKLVTQKREGRVLRCTVNYAKMNALVAYLVKECCQDAGGC